MPYRPVASACAALAILMTSTAAGETPYSTSAPPERFRGDAMAIVYFTSDVEAVCGPADPGYRIVACVKHMKKGKLMVLPTPCATADQDWTSRIYCHELGHINGWSGLHGD